MAATKKQGLIQKKKVWIPVVAPKEFGEQVIGETLVTEAPAAVGRTLTISMATLSGDPQRQSVNVFFRIKGTENGRATTDITGLGWLPAAVRRIVRRSREKMDESFEVMTGDAKRVRIKLLMVGKSKCTRGVTAKLRRLCRAAVQRSAIHKTWVDFIAAIMQHGLQKEVQDALKKTYPLSVCEVRQVHVGGQVSEEEVEKLRIEFPLPKEPPKTEEKQANADEQAPAEEPANEQVEEQIPTDKQETQSQPVAEQQGLQIQPPETKA